MNQNGVRSRETVCLTNVTGPTRQVEESWKKRLQLVGTVLRIFGVRGLVSLALRLSQTAG